MIKRIRDQVRYSRPLQHVTAEEWEVISSKASRAKSFLKEDNEVYALIKSSLFNAETAILAGVKESRDEHVITEGFKRIFITPKQVKTDELVGQIRILSEIVSELQSWIDVKLDFEDKESKNLITIDRRKQDA